MWAKDLALLSFLSLVLSLFLTYSLAVTWICLSFSLLVRVYVLKSSEDRRALDFPLKMDFLRTYTCVIFPLLCVWFKCNAPLFSVVPGFMMHVSVLLIVRAALADTHLRTEGLTVHFQEFEQYRVITPTQPNQAFMNKGLPRCCWSSGQN